MRYPLTSLLHPPSRVPRVLSTAAASGAASATVAPVQWTPALPAPQAAYLHIPFCRRRCFYCDFPIQVVGDRQRTADTASEAYVELLLREILASPEGHAGRPLRSVYFGGGTPSLLPPHLLAKVMRTLRERYGFAGELECTLEMDPGTFDEARLGAFLEAGVTRVSLGTQSFDDALLKACGRAHGLADTERALSLLGAARERGALRELSVDLIGGLPEQTLEQWRHSLAAAAASPATHVSVYDLQVEDGTAFGRWEAAGALPLPEDEVAAQMFRDASAVLGAAGFERYEVSSFARPGHRCKHNRAYWRNEPFWGFGLGATSHVRGRRLARPRRMEGYRDFVGALEAEGWEAQQASMGEAEEELDELQTALMLALRTDAGVDGAQLAARYPRNQLGATAAAACADAAAELPAEWVSYEAQTLRLKNPEGLLFSNDAISTVFARLEERLEDAEQATGTAGAK
eukprot:Transcript_26879.p1 GENE.Transcript_26879~~Transcript_26879.p1  ORF type:complete len:488 (-),score=161.47 Transcript_26879:61-1440(-)